jgi:hypothetical protein
MEKIILLTFDKNIGCFTWRTMYFCDNLSLNYFYERCFTQRMYRKTIFHMYNNPTGALFW